MVAEMRPRNTTAAARARQNGQDAPFCQNICQFSFAFISPLAPEDGAYAGIDPSSRLADAASRHCAGTWFQTGTRNMHSRVTRLCVYIPELARSTAAAERASIAEKADLLLLSPHTTGSRYLLIRKNLIGTKDKLV